MKNNLKIILVKEGLTNAELSRICGVNPVTISKIANNKASGTRPVTKGKIVNGINKHLGKDKYSFEEIFPIE